jgi:carbamoyl-phosphate synthase, small subunit
VPKAYLVLENGQVYEGESFGAELSCAGELVFNTGMIGYTQSLTEPAYSGQILLNTFPQTGGYGVTPADFVSEDGGPCGYIVRSYCKTPSNFRSVMTLNGLLKLRGIPAICDIDTRELTKTVRASGKIYAAIADSKEKALELLNAPRCKPTCGVKQPLYIEADKNSKNHVAILDYGVTNTVLEQLKSRGVNVTLLPQDTSASEILSKDYSAVLISQGPGDPNDYSTSELAKLLGEKLVFGIGLGHQLLALALGGKAARLAHGHRGLNIAAKDLESGRIRLTNQNHGFAVLEGSIPGKGFKVTFENLDDGSIEGIDYTDCAAFSVQFEPSDIEFDRFVLRMEESR